MNETSEKPMPAKTSGLRHLLRSTYFSLCGFKAAFKETAVRHELLLGLVHFCVLPFAGISLGAKVLLSVLWALIVVVELLNTAIEALTDLASPGYHVLAKRTKDLGSAAVSLAIVVFLASWCAFLLPVLMR